MIRCSRGVLWPFLIATLACLGGIAAHAQSWIPGPTLRNAHCLTTSVVLQDGRVLIIGGMQGDNLYSESCEIYDPVANTIRPAAPMKVKRAWHSAVMLRNGKVLVVGGFTGQTIVECELYDPRTDTWSLTGTMHNSRSRTTATLLPNGKVLVAGGYTSDGGGITTSNSCEIYDPLTESWTKVEPMAHTRSSHAAVLLKNGKVLVASGYPYYVSCELFDPATGTWRQTGELRAPLPTGDHSLTMLPDGRVLLAGGWGGTLGMTTRCEIYDPATERWSTAGSLATPRASHRTILLPNGEVIAIGGINATTPGNDASCFSLSSCEIYNPASDSWRSGPQLPLEVVYFAAALLPNGQIFIGGGGRRVPGKMAEAYYTSTFLLDPSVATLRPAGDLRNEHFGASLTLLPTGKVLMVGGDCPSSGSTEVELFDAATNVWQPAATIQIPRSGHRAVLLPNDQVLVAGGMSKNVNLTSTELYDFRSDRWTAGAPMATARSEYSATLLHNGGVMVAGGLTSAGSSTPTKTVELYNVTSGNWVPLAPMSVERFAHTATLLADGRVLVVGGGGPLGSHRSCELYDPRCDVWTPAAPLQLGRAFHTATLLADGRVLVTGGEGNTVAIREADIYDPVTDTWKSAGLMASRRQRHTATLLPNGNVIIVGGYGDGVTAQIETFIPVININGWRSTGVALPENRRSLGAVLLPSGSVLIAGGSGQSSRNCETRSTYLYDPGLGHASIDRPVISSISPQNILITGNSNAILTIAGTGFRDDNNRQGSEASSGDYNSSPVNYPIVRIRRIGGDRFDNDFTAYLPFTVADAQWSANGTQVRLRGGTPAARTFPPGWYAVSVIANGIPSLPVFISLNYTDAPEKPGTIFSARKPECASYSFRVDNPCMIRALVLAAERSDNVRMTMSGDIPSQSTTVTISLIDRSRPGKFAVRVNGLDVIEDSIIPATAPMEVSSPAVDCGVYSLVISNPCKIDSLWLEHPDNVTMTVEESLPATSARVTLRLVNRSLPGNFRLMGDGIDITIDTIEAAGATAVSEPQIDCSSYSFTISNPCGFDSITLSRLDSRNVTVTVDRPLPAMEAHVTVRLIDGTSDGAFTVLLNGGESISGTLQGGASLAMVSPSGLDTLQRRRNHCDSVVIRNMGSTLPIVIDAAWLGRNLEFSIPPSQLPMTILPGEERSLFICFDSPFSSVTNDTLHLSNGCVEFRMPLAARGGMAIEGTGADNCGTPIHLQSTNIDKPMLRALYPTLGPQGGWVRLDIERYVPAAMADLPFEGVLYDGLGNPVKKGRLITTSSRTEGGAFIEKGILEFDVHDCAQGYYLLAISSPLETRSYPIVIVR